MKIKRAEPSEYTGIIDIRLKAYQKYQAVLPSAHWEQLKDILTSGIHLDKGEELFVALMEDSVVGTVVLYPSKSESYEGFTGELEFPEIRLLAVDPHYQGHGIGCALIQHCISLEKGRGTDYIGLHTGEFMIDAQRLYEKIGFYRVPELDFDPAGDGIIVKAYRKIIR